MTAFAEIKKETRAPLMTLVVPPSVFADEWDGKPTDDVALGLRLLSESDIQAARRIATDAAVRDYALNGQIVDVEAYIDACNDGLVREAIARAICDPNDAKREHPLLPCAQDLVQFAFTTEGARFVWDELHRLTVAHSPLVVPITDEEIGVLTSLLTRGALDKLPRVRATPLRKLLSTVFDEVSGIAHLVDADPSPAEDEVGEVTYSVKG